LKDYGFGVDITDARFSGYKKIYLRKMDIKRLKICSINSTLKEDYTEFRWEDVSMT
jgi:hypothetical protein